MKKYRKKSSILKRGAITVELIIVASLMLVFGAYSVPKVYNAVATGIQSAENTVDDPNDLTTDVELLGPIAGTGESIQTGNEIIGNIIDEIPGNPPDDDKIHVESIKIEPASVTIGIGGKATLSATVFPAEAENKSVAWTIDDKSIAVVNGKGEVVGISPGTTYVTCTSLDSGVSARVPVTVNPIEVESLWVYPTSIVLKEGHTIDLTVRVEPNNASDKNIVFTSQNTDIVSVDSNGHVVAASGVEPYNNRTTITVSVGGISQIVEVEVIGDKQYTESVTLNTHDVTLRVNDTYQFTTTIEPSDATDKTLIYTVEDPTILSVQQDGTIKALKEGQTVVKVSNYSGDYYGKEVADYALVTVLPEYFEVTDITLSYPSTTIKVGDTMEPNVAISPQNATNKVIFWESSDSTILTVDENGKVTGVGIGTATITATSASNPSVKESVTITVERGYVDVESITLKDYTVVLPLTETYAIQATVHPENADNKEVTYKSTDETILTVNSNGVVIPLKEGDASVIVTSVDNPSVSATCVIQVREVYPTSITVSSGSSLTMRINQTATFAVNADLSDNNYEADSFIINAELLPTNITKDKVTWTIEDESIAVIKNNVLTPKAVGSTKLTATTENGLTYIVNLTILGIEPESIELNQKEFILNIGDSDQITGRVLPTDATWNELEFKPENTDVITFNKEDGSFVANKLGTTHVTVCVKDRNSVCEQVEIQVVPVLTEEIVPEQEKITILLEETSHDTYVKWTVLPADAENKNVILSSTNEGVVTVDQDGRLIPVEIGTSTIVLEAEDGGAQPAYVEVEVITNIIRPTQIISGETEVTMVFGRDLNKQLDYTVLPEDAENKTLIWEAVPNIYIITDEDGNETELVEHIVTVSQTGIVTPLQVGKATVIATSVVDPSVSITYTINVVEVEPEQIIVTPSPMTIEKGKRLDYTIEILPVDTTRKTYFVVSSNPLIAYEDSLTKEVVAVNEGTCTLTFYSDVNDVYVEVPVVVTRPSVSGFHLEPEELVIEKTGQSKQVVASPFFVDPDTGEETIVDDFTGQITWTPRDNTALTVTPSADTKTATITANKRGVHYVDVEVEGFTKTLEVTVGSPVVVNQNWIEETVLDSNSTNAIVSLTPDDITDGSITITWTTLAGKDVADVIQFEENEVCVNPKGGPGTVVLNATIEDKAFNTKEVLAFTVKFRKTWSDYSKEFEYTDAFITKYQNDLNNGILECDVTDSTKGTWGEWSGWGTTNPGDNSETLEVIKKTLYSYRDYSAWSTCTASGNWQFDKFAEDNLNKNQERTVYQNWTSWSAWSITKPSSTTNTATYKVETTTMYRYRDLGVWSTCDSSSTWQDTKYTENDGSKNIERTVYQNWGNWSSWSTTKPSENTGYREINKTTGYSYRDVSGWTTTQGSDVYASKPQYCKSTRGVGDWSDYGPTEITAVPNEVEVRTATIYRSRTFSSWTACTPSSEWRDTAYSESYTTTNTERTVYQNWTSWSAWSITKPSSTTNTATYKVETTTMYRYRNLGVWSTCDASEAIGTTNTAWTDSKENTENDGLRYDERTIYRNWSLWSSWSTTNPGTATAEKEVENVTGYRSRTFGSWSTCSTSSTWQDSAYTESYTSKNATRLVYRNWSAWSAWSTTNPGTATVEKEIEKTTMYRYRELATWSTCNASSTWQDTPYATDAGTQNATRTVYQNWGNWSSWSTTSVTATTTKQVEDAKGYRSRTFSNWSTCSGTWSDTAYTESYVSKNETRVVYKNWSSWTSWSTTNPGSATAEKKVETTTLYRHRTLATWSTCDASSTWSDTPYATDAGTQNAERVVYQNWGSWSAWSTTKATETATKQVQQATGYRSRTFSSWSSCSGTWSDTAYTESYVSKNETRVVYRNWSNWTSWSTTNPGTANDEKQIKTTTLYRYRELGVWSTCDANSTWSDTKYTESTDVKNAERVVYQNWGNWSSWSTTTVTASATQQVEDAKGYRSRTFGSWSTCNVNSTWQDTQYTESYTVKNTSRIVYRNWSSWSDWSVTNPGSATAEKKVETTTMYRYRVLATWSTCDANSTWQDTPYTTDAGTQNATRVVYQNWGSWSAWSATNPGAATATKQVENAKGYRSRTFGNWSSCSGTWSDTAYAENYTSKNTTRIVYRNWSAWSSYSVTNPGTATAEKEVETTTMYRYRALGVWSTCDASSTWSDSKYTESTDVKNAERVVYQNWGNWSSWSTTKATATTTKQVEDAKGYRSRTFGSWSSCSASSTWQDTAYTESYTSKNATRTVYRNWSSWSTYSTTNPGSQTAEKQVQTTTMYRYRALGVWSTCDANSTWSDTKYTESTDVQNATRVVYQNWGSWSSYSTTAVTETATKQVRTTTMYRSGTYGSWSACSASSTWQDTAYATSETVQNATRTVYRNWSAWTSYSVTNPGTATTEKQVQTTTMYRYRELGTWSTCDASSTWQDTAYTTGTDTQNATRIVYQNWGNWSSYSTTAVTETATKQVRTTTMYRSGTYGSWSTCSASSTWQDTAYTASETVKNATRTVYRNWGSWSAYSTTAVTATTEKQVQTTTMYRYRALGTWSTCNASSTWQDTAYTTDAGTQNATRTVYQNWGSWSAWSLTSATATTTKQVESAKVYRSGTYGSWSTCSTSSTWQDTAYTTSETVKNATRTVYRSRTVNTSWTTTQGDVYAQKTQYCQQTRTANAWSAWQTAEIASTADLEVETATVYRYRDVNTTWTTTKGSEVYAQKTQYCKQTRTVGSWSAYSTTAATSSSTLEVRTATMYRYRDVNTTWTTTQGDVYTSKTQYCKQTRTAGSWGAWQTTAITDGANNQVETTTGYSYREAGDWTTTAGDVQATHTQYSLDPIVNRAVKYSYYLQNLTSGQTMNSSAVHRTSSNGANSDNKSDCKNYGCAYFDHVATKKVSDLGSTARLDQSWTGVGNSASFTSVCIIDYGTNCSGWTNPTSGSSFAYDGKPQFIYGTSASDTGAISGLRVTWTSASTISASVFYIDKDTAQPNVGGIWMGSGLAGEAYGSGLFSDKTTFNATNAAKIYIKQVKDATPSTVAANAWFGHYVTAADMGTYSWAFSPFASDRAQVSRTIYRNWGSWSSYSTTQPTKPSFTTAHNASGQPRLLWSAVPNATKYNVYRATSYDGTYSSVFETTGTSYTHTSATAGTTYYYKLMVTYSDGTTYTSDPVWTSMNATTEMESSFRIRTATMYRQRTYGAWSSCGDSSTWQDSAYATSETVQNATRTVYQNWGSWSAWSTTAATASATRQVETTTGYSTRTVSAWSTCDSSSTWQDTAYTTSDTVKNATRTVYQNWNTTWSSWSTTAVTASATRKVETATGYRSRAFGNWSTCGDSSTWQDTAYTTSYTVKNATRTVYQNWNNWSSWTTTNPGSATTTMKVENKTQYCKQTRSIASWGAWQTTAITDGADNQVQTGTGYRYRNVNTTWTTTAGDVYTSKTQYCKQTRTVGEWSAYSTTNPGASSSTQEVQTTTGYRYRTVGDWTTTQGSDVYDDKTQYCKQTRSIASWGAWQTTAITDGADNQVQTTTGYSYRDVNAAWTTTQGDVYAQKTQYCKQTRTVGNWTDWSTTNPGASSSTQEVQTTTGYRYRTVGDWTTTQGSDVYDDKTQYCKQTRSIASWGAWQTTAITDGANNQVQTTTGYSYRDVDTTWTTTQGDVYTQKTQYCKQTRTVGEWTAWSTSNPGTSTSTKEVQTTTGYSYRTVGDWTTTKGSDIYDDKTQYCQQTRTANAWGAWQTAAITPTNDLEVETATVYRYRDVNTAWTTTAGDVYTSKTQYCKQTRTVGSWSTWSTTNPGASSSTQEVETATGYRYRTVSDWTTTKGSDVYDQKTQYCQLTRTANAWSDWTTTVIEPTTDKEVEIGTIYRYRNVNTTWTTTKGDIYAEKTQYCKQTRTVGEWTDWSTTNPGASSSTQEVESTIGYRYKVVESWTTTKGTEVYSQKTQYCKLTRTANAWSAWQTAEIASTADLEVETATVYRYRNVNTTWTTTKGDVYTSKTQYCKQTRTVGNWTEWSTTNPGASTSTKEVENTTGYSYRTVGNWVTTEGSDVYAEKTQYCQLTRTANAWLDWSTTVIASTTDKEVETATIYRYRDVVTTWTTTKGDVYAEKTQYCKQTRTVGNWTDWSTTNPGTSSSTQEVESTTGYRYKTVGDWTTEKGSEIYTQKNQYCQLTRTANAWSDWSPAVVTATADKEVETSTIYRYRDVDTTWTTTKGDVYAEKTQYCKQTRTVGEWTDWSITNPGESSSTQEVETAQGYRYRTVGGWTTSKGSDVYDEKTQYCQLTRTANAWSDWSPTVATATTDKEVETTTIYRYRTVGSWSLTAGSDVYTSKKQYCAETRTVSDWSDWSTTKVDAIANQKEVETTAGYRTKSVNTTWTTSKGSEVYNSKTQYCQLTRTANAWSDWTTSATTATSDKEVESTMGYSSRTLTDWTTCSASSTWVDTPYTESVDVKNIERTVYRNWGAWSSYSTTNPGSETAEHQVKTTDMYQYRDVNTTWTITQGDVAYSKKQYCLSTRTVGDWTEWSTTNPGASSATKEVENTTGYRTKSVNATWTTSKGSEVYDTKTQYCLNTRTVTDWTDWSTTNPGSTTDTRDVKTADGYNYRRYSETAIKLASCRKKLSYDLIDEVKIPDTSIISGTTSALYELPQYMAGQKVTVQFDATTKGMCIKISADNSDFEHITCSTADEHIKDTFVLFGSPEVDPMITYKATNGTNSTELTGTNGAIVGNDTVGITSFSIETNDSSLTINASLFQNGEWTAMTSGQFTGDKATEATGIKMALSGANAEYYSLQYAAYTPEKGWSDWTDSAVETKGNVISMVRVKLVPKVNEFTQLTAQVVTNDKYNGNVNNIVIAIEGGE